MAIGFLNQTGLPPNPSLPLLPPESLARLRRFTRSEYHQIGESGIIAPEEKVELLDGLIVEKPVKSPAHQGVTRRLTTRLPRVLPPGWFVQIQDVVGLASSEPEPDGSVLRGDETSYDTRQPEPSDVGFVIEAADSSLRTDRREKGRLYAQAGIPIYWIINVEDSQIEVYSDPDPTAVPPAYATRKDYRPGDDVPIVLDGQRFSSIPAGDLIP